MPSHVRIACAVSLLLALLAAPSVHAQNLLANGSFAEVLGLTHWATDSVLISWSSTQCPGFQLFESGSARFDLGAVGSSAGTLSQCVAATPGHGYELSGSIFLAASPTGSQGALRLRFVAGTCESWSTVGFATSFESLQGECVHSSFFSRAPPQTDAAIVELELTRTTFDSSPAAARFDDIVLLDLPEPAAAGAAAALSGITALGYARAQRPRSSPSAANAAAAHAHAEPSGAETASSSRS